MVLKNGGRWEVGLKNRWEVRDWPLKWEVGF